MPWAKKWWASWEANIEVMASQQGISAQDLAERMVNELFKEKLGD